MSKTARVIALNKQKSQNKPDHPPVTLNNLPDGSYAMETMSVMVKENGEITLYDRYRSVLHPKIIIDKPVCKIKTSNIIMPK